MTAKLNYCQKHKHYGTGCDRCHAQQVENLVHECRIARTALVGFRESKGWHALHEVVIKRLEAVIEDPGRNLEDAVGEVLK